MEIVDSVWDCVLSSRLIIERDLSVDFFLNVIF